MADVRGEKIVYKSDRPQKCPDKGTKINGQLTRIFAQQRHKSVEFVSVACFVNVVCYYLKARNPIICLFFTSHTLSCRHA